MSRILLADDSPHAQRMGERILRDEGYEVVTVSDGETALLRLEDADPELILADVFLPGKSGYEICETVKAHPRHKHARVVLTAGLLEHVDEEMAARVAADLVLKKPFEASAVLAAIKPLIEAAEAERAAAPLSEPETSAAESAAAVEESAAAPAPEETATTEEPAAVAAACAEGAPQEPPAAYEIDAERVRAAVVVALDRAMPALIDELTERVLIALGR